MNKFTIKDLENLSGIKAHTIRIWEQRYSFLKPQRTATNIRYYSGHELKMLLNISLLNKYGFKISHIDRMSEEELRAKTLTLTNNEAQQERVINELIQYMADLEMDAFEELIEDQIKALGVERTISQILFPFLERIGILWLTDHINPAQEHLTTNVIRQKLIVGINGINGIAIHKSKILLFLPENEHHEVGLLFLHYILKARGFKVIYLGANVPMKDLEFVVENLKPNFIYTHLTTVIKEFNFDKFLQQVKNKFPYQQILMSGTLLKAFEKKALPSNIRVLKSFDEVNDFIRQLP
ncbi:MerR family transcriptional regulator [Lacibacter luteus]|uniref:MerR family transcriptional regulator n=1 Tax=Lacibacter luteus TaxID=2508719 RepID=A0A4Q1CGY7_9BACT|nr:MerR family transcriptional regulator [Lacibacter luteus]RXK59435.1 MerR family transcriptional regulator [Lacibacter luteus]